MKTIKPCSSCNGGIPYIAPYFKPNDTYQDDGMYIVRCQNCGACGSIEYKEDDAVDKWNNSN